MPRNEVLTKILFAIGIVFSIMWVISAFLPRSFSWETLAHFEGGFLDEVSRRANLSYVSTGIQSMVTLSTLYFFVNRKYKGGTLFGTGLARQVSPVTAFWVGLLLAIEINLLLTFVNLPFRIYNFWFLERTFGLSRLSLPHFLVELVKAWTLNLLIHAAAGGVTAVLLARFSGTWPYLLAILLFFGSIFFAYLYPSVIAPMFDEFTPLEDPAVLASVQELAAKAGMKVDRVLVMQASSKTARTNAYFTGLGKTKQVVLYDTLLSGHSIDEVRLVLAHELGHWKYGHIMRGIAVSAAATLLLAVAFAYVWGPIPSRVSVGELRHLFTSLVLFAVLASYATTPCSSYLSRRNEIQADLFALDLTGEPHFFVSTMKGLAKTNLGDVDPPPFVRWFAWTHPTTIERIIMGERWKTVP